MKSFKMLKISSLIIIGCIVGNLILGMQPKDKEAKAAQTTVVEKKIVKKENNDNKETIQTETEFVINENLFLRSQMDYNKENEVFELKKGDKVDVISKDSKWAKILYKGKVYYASSVFLGKTLEDEQQTINIVRTTEFTNVFSEKNEKVTYVSKNHDFQLTGEDGNFFKISYQGANGKIPKDKAQKILNVNEEQTSYLSVENGVLWFNSFYTNGNGKEKWIKFEYGDAPKNLSSDKKYISFDKRKINGEETVQYFQYLSIRTPGVYTAKEIDDFLAKMKPDSPLIGTGKDFVEAAKKYNLNELYLVAHAIHESNWGTSEIAQKKKNLFGYKAVDSNAFEGAAEFSSFRECIFEVAKYVDTAYGNPTDWRFKGSIVGDKARGMNVRYASDPVWGSRIASYMYIFDKEYGRKMHNKYEIYESNSKVEIYDEIGNVVGSSVEPYFTVKSKKVINGINYLEVIDRSGSIYIQESNIRKVNTI